MADIFKELLDFDQENDLKAAANDLLLDEVLEAWDSLPMGNHSIARMQRWLIDDMAPAMMKIRNRNK